VSANDQRAFETTFVQDGKFEYAVEKGENSDEPSYQEVSGAPVESRSPLGYHVGAITIVSPTKPLLANSTDAVRFSSTCRRWSAPAYTRHQRKSDHASKIAPLAEILRIR
jgi:hypothetical protein